MLAYTVLYALLCCTFTVRAVELPWGEVLSLERTIQFGQEFREVIEIPEQLSGSSVVAEWESKVSDSDREKHGLPDVVLMAAVGEEPETPKTDGKCSRYEPCLGDQADVEAFERRDTRAMMKIERVEEGEEVHVILMNFNRGRTLSDGAKTKPTLEGVLRIWSGVDVCGGLTEEQDMCLGRGTCRDGDCKCEEGWGGRFCEWQVENVTLKERPVNTMSQVQPLRNSMIVDTGERGRMFRWTEEDGKVLVRAKLLLGRVRLENGVIVGKGGGLGIYVREGGIPSERDEVKVVVDGDDIMEFVTVREGGEKDLFVWVAKNVTQGTGEGGVSLHIAGCGGEGEEKCPGKSGIWRTVAIAVGSVSGGILLVSIVLGLGWICGKKRRGRGTGGTQEGNWEGVEVRRKDNLKEGRIVVRGITVDEGVDGYLGRGMSTEGSW